MARNKRTPAEDAPVAESSDSEQPNNSDQETDGSGSESESESNDATIPNPNNHVEEDETDKPSDADVGPNPESESGSESETDSDSGPPPNFTIQPINSKQQQLPTPLKSNKSGSKRAAEAEAELGLKELKKAKVEDTSVKKAPVIQRVFSEDDEVALLEGVAEFHAKEGTDPYSDIIRFHEFIKKSIHFDVSPNQLKEKIRRLKGKYLALVKKSGEDPVITKSHDLKVFNLSKKLWGSGSNVAAVKGKKSPKSNKDSGDGGVGGGITLALASKGEEGIIAKKQKKVVNGGATKKKEAGQGKGNKGGADRKGDDAEEDQVEYKNGDAEEDFSVEFPLCVGSLKEAESLSEESRDFWVQNLGLIGKAKLKQYEAKLQEIKWAELDLFIRKKELINEKLRLLRDAASKSIH